MNKKFTCQYCGGGFSTRQNYDLHIVQEQSIYIPGKENVDYVSCKECGMRVKSLMRHLAEHDLTVESYKEKYPGSFLRCKVSAENISESISLARKRSIHKDDKPCKYCGEIVNHRTENIWNHYQECVEANKKMTEGTDYVVCPICKCWKEDLVVHLSRIHKIDREKRKELYPDLKVQADVSKQRAEENSLKMFGVKHHLSSEAVKEKRKQTNLKRFGVENVFSSSIIKEKKRQTSLKRYGTDHPMQCAEVKIKQTLSAQNGPSDIEKIMIEHVTCTNLVYTGGGNKYIRLKLPVEKNHKIQMIVNPDFVVYPDVLVGKVLEQVKANKNIDVPFRVTHVIELFGEYYHGEEVIGLKEEDHVKQYVDAYEATGIKCLVLWGREISDWNNVRDRVEVFLKEALVCANSYGQEQYMKQLTKKLQRVDRRKKSLDCPLGSGQKFRTQETLNSWLKSDSNLYRAGLVEGVDYVKCPHCDNYRARTMSRHLKRVHGVELEVALEVPSVKENKIKSNVAKAGTMTYEKKVNPFEGKDEGKDYVACSYCGYRGKNLTNHLNHEHADRGGAEKYEGKLRSDSCEEALKQMAENTWKTRRQKSRKVYLDYDHCGWSKQKDAWLRKATESGFVGVDVPSVYLLSGPWAGELAEDEYFGEVEGVGVVTCSVCGERGQSLVRHVMKVHGEDVLKSYVGRLTCEKLEKERSEVAKKQVTSKVRSGGKFVAELCRC